MFDLKCIQLSLEQIELLRLLLLFLIQNEFTYTDR